MRFKRVKKRKNRIFEGKVPSLYITTYSLCLEQKGRERILSKAETMNNVNGDPFENVKQRLKDRSKV